MTTGRINQVTGTGPAVDDGACAQCVQPPDLLVSCMNATNCSGPWATPVTGATPRFPVPGHVPEGLHSPCVDSAGSQGLQSQCPYPLHAPPIGTGADPHHLPRAAHLERFAAQANRRTDTRGSCFYHMRSWTDGNHKHAGETLHTTRPYLRAYPDGDKKSAGGLLRAKCSNPYENRGRSTLQAARGEQPVRPLAASLASLESPLRRALRSTRNPAAGRKPAPMAERPKAGQGTEQKGVTNLNSLG